MGCKSKAASEKHESSAEWNCITHAESQRAPQGTATGVHLKIFEELYEGEDHIKGSNLR